MCIGNPTAANGLVCDDGEECTGDGVCQDGACVDGPPINEGVVCQVEESCTADRVCTEGTCSAGDPVSKDGQACDNGNICTDGDVCMGGTCVGGPPAMEGAVCELGVECNADKLCNEGTCTPGDPVSKDGQACSDDNICTDPDECMSGICVAGPPAMEGVVCELGEECTPNKLCASGSCSPGDPTSKNGTACDDGIKCTKDDKCISGGLCEGTPVELSEIQPGGQQCVVVGITEQPSSFFISGDDPSNIKWDASGGDPSIGKGNVFSTTFFNESQATVTAQCIDMPQIQRNKRVNVLKSCSVLNASEELLCPNGFSRVPFFDSFQDLLIPNYCENENSFTPATRLGRVIFDEKDIIGFNLPAGPEAVFASCADKGEACVGLESINENLFIGLNSQGNIDIEEKLNQEVTSATKCADILRDIRPPQGSQEFVDFGPQNKDYWSRRITEIHERAHIADYRSMVVIPTISEVKAEIVIDANCQDCESKIPSKFEKSFQEKWKRHRDNDYYNRPLAPTPGGGLIKIRGWEKRAYAVSNPLFNNVVNKVLDRAEFLGFRQECVDDFNLTNSPPL